jgi:Tol biopolymer transport system component
LLSLSAGNSESGNGPSTLRDHVTKVNESTTWHMKLRPEAMSWNGRYVVFASQASNLVTDDNNGTEDIFLKDLAQNSITLVSVALNNASANGASRTPVISGNGRFVAFTSEASNLVSNDTNGLQDVFVKDLQSGITELVSVNSSGTGSASSFSEAPQISADGRYVTFQSEFQSDAGNRAIYLRDRATQTTAIIGTSTPLIEWESMSPKGTRLAYQLRGSPLTLWTYDVTTGETNQIDSVGGVHFLSFSRDGDRLLYIDERKANDAFVLKLRDFSENSLSLLATNVRNAVISPDGKYVAYEKIGLEGFGYPANYDQAHGLDPKLVLLKLADNSSKVLYNSYLSKSTLTNLNLSFSGNSRFLSFASAKSDIVPNDTNGVPDVFLYDRAFDNIEIVSALPSGESANGSSMQPVMSYEGNSIVFESNASNLNNNDRNDATDIFLSRITKVDSDGDGMDDGDELLLFGNLDSTGKEDLDGDGASDWAEVQAGSNPNGGAEFLGFTTIHDTAGVGRIEWQSIPGKTYQLQTKSSLDDTEWFDAGNPIIAVSTNSAVSYDLTDKTAVYRILLK